jgi:peptidoglycan/xylan/chitin deacetylase (PgdA/CDA1 family)
MASAALNDWVRALYRVFAARTYPGGPSCCLPILVYHRVLPRPDPFQPDALDAAAAAWQFKLLADVFTVIPLDEACDRLRRGTLPPRALAITFDDGYRDNHDVALPLLRGNGLTATFFVSTGMLDGGRMFHDTALECMRRYEGTEIDLSFLGMGQRPLGGVAARVAVAREVAEAIKYLPCDERDAHCARLVSLAGVPLPDDLMMRPEHVLHMAREGMGIGGHTHRHPNLARSDADTVRRELQENQSALASITGEAPTTFAYPFGSPGVDYNRETADLVREAGFKCAVTMSWGVATAHADPFQLPRFSPTETRPATFTARVLRMSHHRNPRIA